MSLQELINKDFNKLTQKLSSILNNRTYKIDAKVTKYDEKIINIYDNKDDLILSANYETIGTYDMATSILFWESAFQLFPKSELYEQMNLYKKELSDHIINRKYNDSKFMEEMYYYITNNICYINDKNIENLMKLIIHITKHMGIIDESTEDNKKIFYVITNILTIK